MTQSRGDAENDQKLLARLVDIRSAKADDPDGSMTDAEYADAFREAGIDVASLPRPRPGRRSRPGPPRCECPWRPHWTTGRPCAGTIGETKQVRCD